MNGLNPYSSPPEPIFPPQEKQFKDQKQYSLIPVMFRPSIFSIPIAILFALILIVGTTIVRQIATESVMAPDVNRLITLMSIFGILGTSLCFLITWIRVLVVKDGIQKRDLTIKKIPFETIKSWHQDKRTGRIELSLSTQPQPLLVCNWAMTRKNSSTLAKILLSKVGAPENPSSSPQPPEN